MYVLVSGQEVVQYPLVLQLWRIQNPSISLPVDPTDEQLAEQGIYTVTLTPKPNVDYTEDVTEKDPVYVDDCWTQVWEVAPATPEEIAIREEKIKENNKNKAMSLLTETDWTQLNDVSLINKDEFASYRQDLRTIVFNPQVDSIFPVKPQEQWPNTATI